MEYNFQNTLASVSGLLKTSYSFLLICFHCIYSTQSNKSNKSYFNSADSLLKEDYVLWVKPGDKEWYAFFCCRYLNLVTQQVYQATH